MQLALLAAAHACGLASDSMWAACLVCAPRVHWGGTDRRYRECVGWRLVSVGACCCDARQNIGAPMRAMRAGWPRVKTWGCACGRGCAVGAWARRVDKHAGWGVAGWWARRARRAWEAGWARGLVGGAEVGRVRQRGRGLRGLGGCACVGLGHGTGSRVWTRSWCAVRVWAARTCSSAEMGWRPGGRRLTR